MRSFDPSLLSQATPAELEAIEQALTQELALSSPADYAQHCWSQYVRPRHIEVLNTAITDLTSGRLVRPDNGEPYRGMIVTMPPRHGKSELISRFTPAWYVSKYPDRRVILASYESDFASDWGGKARALILEHPELGVTLDPTTQSKSNWRVQGARGGMTTAGAGGPITGKGADLFIIDDPFKSNEDADSELQRQKIWDWYLSTVLTRLEKDITNPDAPPPVILLVQTRWHMDDLAGRLLDHEPDAWFHFNLPAIAGPNDALGRSPGEALWPEKYDLKALSLIRESQESMGLRWWSSLYQQNPIIEGGGILPIDHIRYFTYVQKDKARTFKLRQPDGAEKSVPETKLGKFVTADLAATTKNSADFTVFCLWGYTPDEDLMLLDVWRKRIESAEHLTTAKMLWNAWKPRFLGVEKATYGLTLLQMLVREGQIATRELKPDGDKVARAYAAGALLRAGRVYLPKGAPWVTEWLSEMQAFDKGKHDDQVDCFAYAAKICSDRTHAPRPPRSKDPETTEEKIWESLRGRRKKAPTHPTLGRMW